MVSYRWITLVILISCLASISTAWGNGLLSHTSFSDWRDDSEYYNARALSLIHNGSLGEDKALFRRPPGYSVFLAVVYGVFGEHILAAWIVQVILFGFILFLWWLMSMRFLEGGFTLLPPLFMGLYWGFHIYAFSIGSEMFSVFLLSLFIFFLFRYQDAPRLRYLVFVGLVAGVLALTKPIFLYAVPFLLGWVLYQKRNFQVFFHATICFGIVGAMVGGWALRTYFIFGEMQTERVGHIIYTRALYGTLSGKEIGLHLAASVTGNYVVEQFSPGYGAEPVPQRLGVKRITAYNELVRSGFSPAVAEQQLLHEGVSLIRKYPLSFLAGAAPLLFDLNTPQNLSGFPINSMFVGTREYLPSWQKITILLAVRMAWFFVLGISLFGCFLLLRDISRRDVFLPLLFLVLFFNGIHTLIIIPAEPRFLVPVLPVYFLCFGVGISWFLTRVKKICSVETP